MNAPALEILYTNYQGKTALRRITPIRVYYGQNEWHPEPQWLMDAIDMEKEQHRTFAMKDIHWMR